MKINFREQSGINTVSFTGKSISSGYTARIDRKLSEQIRTVIDFSAKIIPTLKDKDSITLRSMGIRRLAKTLEEGITFIAENKNYILSRHENNAIRVRIQDPKTEKIEDSILVMNEQIAKTNTKNDELPQNIEFYKFRVNILEKEALLKKCIDDIDYLILNIRRNFIQQDTKPQLIFDHPDILPLTNKKKTTKISYTKKEPNIQKTKPSHRRSLKRMTPIKIKEPNGKLNEETGILADDIIKEFNEIHKNLSEIKNSKTRNLIKNGYSRIEKGVAGSKVLEFSIKHPYINKISVNMINDHYKRNLVITTKEFGGPDKIIVITPDKEVYKTIPMGILRDSTDRTGKPQLQFFTQNDIDEKDFDTLFKLVLENLKNYENFINSKISRLNTKKQYHSTTEAGSTEKFNCNIKLIHNNLTYFLKNINKYSDKPKERNRFKKINDIDIIAYKSKPVKVFLKDITPDRKSVYMKFGKNQDKNTLQILVHHDNKIEKTYQIIDNKLLKYNAPQIGHRPHYDRNMYYYTQEEIDTSGLEDILKIIKRHLSKVNSQIKEKIDKK